ncbi:MAG TPA: InlB B-repeat-containing protein, partial [Spirochaetota bacterium]|nr:InlB B-repeat-containing protein [Spirochaetota bacterium]
TGGSAVESQRIFEGNLATKPSDPTRTGYTFSGWYKESECIDQWNFVVDTVAEPIILYARWIGETYTVTFDKQSGMGGTDSAIATYGSDMPTATAPTRTGYTFTGYWDATSGGTQYYTESMASARSWNKAENTTLYARWTVNTYTITFDKQSGTGGTDSVTATYGAAMPTATKPTRTGYTFDGYWDATSGGGTQYYTESMASARSWDKAANTTLYAGWTANQYTVTFDSNGGSSVDQQTINYGEKATRPVIPTKTGYIFSGWYKESTLTNLWDFGSDSVTADTILYAGWVFDSNPALWAKSVTAGTSYSEFNSVAVDSSGNVYAAGYQNENGSFTYGPGVSVAGTYSGGDYGYNVVLVKYDSSGTALWAKSVTAGNNYSQFYSVAVDSSGNVYAAGYQKGTGSFTYGEGVSVAGTYSGGYYSRNVVLVKYNSTGTALWAKSVTAGTNESLFNSVAVDSSGNIYAAGCQDGTRSYTYGEGVSVAGSYSYGANVVLVKYDATP